MASGIDKNKLLTIAIPTYNRANRLNKSLSDLFEQIIKSKKQEYLTVFVSNNGSTDTTAEILDKHSTIYKQNNISFFVNTFSENFGFDINVLNCYRNAYSEYIWFLSDDDNIIDGAINSIIDDIHIYTPSILYYNFDQNPYNLQNPHVKTNHLYNNVDIKNIQSIYKIIKFPKLTSIVIAKMSGEAGEKSKENKYNYMHIALAMQTALDYGNVFHSEKFIAFPDDDFMDHIDFVPFIVNDLIKTVSLVLHQNNKMQFNQYIKLETVNPLTSSIYNLSCYYRGKCILTPELKSKLYSIIATELKNPKIYKIMSLIFIKTILKLFMGYAYNIGHFIFTGKSATKLRTIKKTI